MPLRLAASPALGLRALCMHGVGNPDFSAPGKRAGQADALLVMHDEAERQFAALLAGLLDASAAENALLTQMAREHIATGGKRLRARLAVAAGTALGAPLDASVAWAAACELLHNATLVHDDVQDGDTSRRGQPTVWVRHGVAQAINLGDWLFMRALAAVDEASSLADTQRLALVQALRKGLETVIAGQVAECAFRGGNIVSVAHYAQMVRQKTAALFVLPVYGAALCAGMSREDAKTVSQSFDGLGEMFQWVDDVIDLFGDKGRDKPGQDLYEGKMSALVVTHAQHHEQDAPFLTALLHRAREATLDADVSKARDLFVAGDSLRLIAQHIQTIAGNAAQCCDTRLQLVHEQLLDAIRAPLFALDADAQQVMHAA